jgi:hypothetical protein
MGHFPNDAAWQVDDNCRRQKSREGLARLFRGRNLFDDDAMNSFV